MVEKGYDIVDGVVGSVILAPHIVKVLESEFGKLNGNDVILRKERLEHIRERHPEVADLVKEKYKEILNNPDYILEDRNNSNTVLTIKEIEEKKNISIIIKTAVLKDEMGYKSSIITSYTLNNKRLKREIKKRKILYKKEK